MKNINLTHNDDLKIKPESELLSKTLYAMCSAENEKRNHVPSSRKKLIVGVYLAATALFLMSMGYRVFDYLTFVPGMGIVSQEQEMIFTLEHTVKSENNDYTIEAVSMIPVLDGENIEKWMVTVMTNEPHDRLTDSCGTLIQPEPLYLTSPDGNEAILDFDGGNRLGTTYKGYIESADDTDYTLYWRGEDHTLSMKSLENSAYADYSYPVSNGLTVIAFPIADGSDKLIFDIMIDTEDENWKYWAENTGSISLEPYGVTVTDTLGNVYDGAEIKQRYMKIPESEKENGINAYLGYKSETYLVLDRRLEAPAASVSVEGISIFLENLRGPGTYNVKIPMHGETIFSENLPDKGVFINHHGIKAEFDSISSEFSEERRGYEVVINVNHIGFDFLPDATEAYIDMRFMNASEAAVTPKYKWGRAVSYPVVSGDALKTVHRCVIDGLGDMNPKITPLESGLGEEIAIELEMLLLRVEGNWNIDFTTTADK